MKLIYCPKCDDVVRLISGKLRKCICKRSWGQYMNEVDAKIGGEAIPIGFANSSFVQAIHKRPHDGMGSRFEAFVIPVVCDTVQVETDTLKCKKSGCGGTRKTRQT